MCPAQIERRKHPGAIGDFQKERGRVFVVRIARAVIVGAVTRNSFVAVDRPSILTVLVKASLASIPQFTFRLYLHDALPFWPADYVADGRR